MLIVNKAREAAACAEANCASSFTNATNAAISATNAANSATAAAASAAAAATSETNTENLWEQFNALYLGSFAVAPTTDNEGNPLQEGALYWNSVSNTMFAWNGSAWATATNFNEFTNFTATGTTTARNLVTRFSDVVNVKDFGAVGDGVADDTAAIQAAITATTIGKTLFFPSGVYTFSTQLVFNTSKIGIIGEGSGTTFLKYTGANTTNDLIVVGGGIANCNISGFTIFSQTVMTGGFALHLYNYGRSNITDIIVNGQDIAPVNIHSGIWFDGIDDVYLSTFRTYVQAEGVRVNGYAGVGQPKAGLMVEQGKITGGTIGIRVGGAFGGIYVNNVDIIAASQDGFLVDTAIVNENNREIFLGVCSIDSVNPSANGRGVRINETLASGQTFTICGTWIASCGVAIYAENAASYQINVVGARIFNNSGDGINCNDNTCSLSVRASSITNNGSWGITGNFNGNNVIASDNTFAANVTGDINNTLIPARYTITQGEIIQQELLIGDQATVAPTGRNLTILDGSNTEQQYIAARNAAYTSTVFTANVDNKTSATDYSFIRCGNASGGVFRVRGDGQIFSDFGTITTPADYAEMFEWEDGNPNNEDRVGQTVSLIGNKIKISENGETPIGVVSANPVIVGDAAPFKWNKSFIKDEYGRTLEKSFEYLEWTEIDNGEFHFEKDSNGKKILVVDRQGGEIKHCYKVDEIPKNLIVPENAKKIIAKEFIENPNWDKTKEYIPRIERKEWSAIGLLGKLRIRKGQVTSPTWIKMSDISDSIEEWLIK